MWGGEGEGSGGKGGGKWGLGTPLSIPSLYLINLIVGVCFLFNSNQPFLHAWEVCCKQLFGTSHLMSDLN